MFLRAPAFLPEMIDRVLGWLVLLVAALLLLSQFVAVVAGLLLLVTLPWRDLLDNTEAQVRLLLAMGVMTLGVGQFALLAFLSGFPQSPEEQAQEEGEGPVFVLPPSAFFPHGGKRRRRQRNK
jgi:hypothetical protein